MRTITTLVLILLSSQAQAILRVIDIKSPKVYLLSSGDHTDSSYKFFALDFPPKTVAIIYAISTYEQKPDSNHAGLRLSDQLRNMYDNGIVVDSVSHFPERIQAGQKDGAVMCYVMPGDPNNRRKFEGHGDFDFIKRFSRSNYAGGAVYIQVDSSSQPGQVFIAVQNPSYTGQEYVAVEAIAITDWDDSLTNRARLFYRFSDTVDNRPTRISFVVPPVFNGDVNNYLVRNLRYPENERQKGIEGRVGIEFDVLENGKISNIKFKAKTGTALDDEAMRVIQIMPDWIPARIGGENVKAHFAMPISFRLE